MRIFFEGTDTCVHCKGDRVNKRTVAPNGQIPKATDLLHEPARSLVRSVAVEESGCLLTIDDGLKHWPEAFDYDSRNRNMVPTIVKSWTADVQQVQPTTNSILNPNLLEMHSVYQVLIDHISLPVIQAVALC